MSLALGIDSSTQSCSAIVIDTANSTVVAETIINFGESLPQYNAPNGFITNGIAGEVHANPLMWLDALELVLEQLSFQCDLTKVRAISGAGQQHGSVYLNESWFDTVFSLNADQSLSEQISNCLSRRSAPIWMDNSTTEECQEITTTIGSSSEVCAKSGSIAIERFTGPQIRRFYKEEPSAYQNTARIHLVSSFICSILSGGDAPIDTGDGAGMNLMHLDRWDWDPELLAATAPDLADKLPTIHPGTTNIGFIAEYFVSKFGFSPNTPITIFTGDNPSSLVGMGAAQPGKVVLSLGTSDTFFAAMPEVVADPEGCGHVFGNPFGGSMSLQCFVNGSLAREAVKDRFSYGWDQFSEALNQTPAGNEGQLMLPFFRPEISPPIELNKPKLKGNSQAFENWEQPEAAIRACIEGQFINMKLRSDWMQLRQEVIYLTGGASQNDAIAQVVADIFQCKVQRLSVSGSVALGGALRAAVQSLQCDTESLEAEFCKVDTVHVFNPQVTADCYADAFIRFEELLKHSL